MVATLKEITYIPAVSCCIKAHYASPSFFDYSIFRSNSPPARLLRFPKNRRETGHLRRCFSCQCRISAKNGRSRGTEVDRHSVPLRGEQPERDRLFRFRAEDVLKNRSKPSPFSEGYVRLRRDSESARRKTGRSCILQEHRGKRNYTCRNLCRERRIHPCFHRPWCHDVIVER
jgi:hypothetical protein